jgi:deoxyribonuclease-1
MTEAHDPGDRRGAPAWRVITAVAVACVLGVAVQGARASEAKPNMTTHSFSQAKKLMRQVFAGHERTFYYDCAYQGNIVDLDSCGYHPKQNPKRARQMEWEHVVPAEAFGQAFPEWRDGHPTCADRKGQPFKGRHCTAKVAKLFRFMEADLYNLQPAITEVNRLRLNHSMAMIDGEPRLFGSCDLEIADRKIEPRPDIRGDIARTSCYMNAAYPGRGVISEKNRSLLEAWDREDPVDAWERERVRRIERLQGNRNPFVQ